YRRYWGYDCVKRFCDDIYGEIAPKAEEAKANVYVFAHNAKGYDSHFILRDLFSREFTTKPEIIMVGNKILKLDIGNIRFMDSLCIFQQPLDKLPKAYGLSEIKGFFPHEFNQEANFNYEGPMPDLKYFELEYMTPSKAAEIKCWYDEQVANDYVFNFEKELTIYCLMDVTGIDPITRCFTLASIGLEVFQAKILQDETIGITPIEGYREAKNFSKTGAAWLYYMEEKINTGKSIEARIKILREQKKGPFFVDGFCEKTNTVYEYNGCAFHGCEKCYPNENEIAINWRTHKENKLYTQRKMDYLRQRGFNIVIGTDCELKKLL
ncbi:hypothetical protein B4U79_10732, partial [Dinothrombium tinctorium]